MNMYMYLRPFKSKIWKKLAILFSLAIIMFTFVPSFNSDSYLTARADDGYTAKDIKYGGRTFKASWVKDIMQWSSKYKVLPSFFIVQAMHETAWGSASTAGRVDHNWTGIKVGGKHAVKITKGSYATDDGGYYAHYASVSDFFHDYYGWLKNNNYKVFGQASFDKAVKGLFTVGGATGNYASAGYDSYSAAMRVIRNGMNKNNHGYLDKLDKAIVSNGKWNGSIQGADSTAKSTKTALKAVKEGKVDNTFTVNGYQTITQKDWDESLAISKKIVKSPDLQNDLNSSQKSNLQDWKDSYNSFNENTIIKYSRMGIGMIALLCLLYAILILIAYSIDRLGLLDFGTVELITGNRMRTAFPDEDSTFFNKTNAQSDEKLITLKDVIIIIIACAGVFAMIMTGQAYHLAYVLYQFSQSIINWGNSLH